MPTHVRVEQEPINDSQLRRIFRQSVFSELAHAADNQHNRNTAEANLSVGDSALRVF